MSMNPISQNIINQWLSYSFEMHLGLDWIWLWYVLYCYVWKLVVQCCAYTGFSIHSMACSVALDDGVLHKVEAAAYWTAVVPNVEEYGSVVARAITSGDENVAKRILWRGVMTVDMLPWGTRCSRRGSKSVILRPRSALRCSGESNGSAFFLSFHIKCVPNLQSCKHIQWDLWCINQ